MILPVTRDHLDYHADLREYVEAKASICSRQAAGDWVVASAADAAAGELAARSPGGPSGSGPADPWRATAAGAKAGRSSGGTAAGWRGWLR